MERPDPPVDLAVLRSTNVSRPQFERPASKRSVVATTEEEPFYSPVGYQPVSPIMDSRSITPPMNPVPEDHVHRRIHPDPSEPGAETFLPSTKMFMGKLAEHAREGEPAHMVDVHPSQIYNTQSSPTRRKPSSRPASSRYSGGVYSQLDPIVSPPTPGADDNAVRFALDQLTRDEEVRGSRHYPAGRWSEHLPEQTALLDGNRDGVPQWQYASAVVEPSYTYVSPIATHAPVEEPLPAAHLSPVRAIPAPAPAVPISPVLRAPPQQRTIVTQPVVPLQAQPPIRTYPQVQPVVETALPRAPETFAFYDGNAQALKYLPTILRPLFLGLYILLCLLMLVALLFSGAWSSTKRGLWAYSTFGGDRWFVFKFLPTLCCMIMLLWLFQIQAAVQRITPFIAMHSSNQKSRTEAPLMEVQPTNFLLPKLFYFRAGQPMIGIFMLLAWLQIFTPPLFATLYNPFFYPRLGVPGAWIWDAVQGVVWTLAALYFLLLVGLILLALWIWRQHTGVNWDPRSLASIVAVLDRSNVIRHYDNSETFRKPTDFRERLAYRSDFLGYWTTNRRIGTGDSVFYAVGEEGGEVPRSFTLPNQEKHSTSMDVDRNRYSYDGPAVAEGPVVTNLETHDDLYTVRHRYLPWYLRTPFILLFCVLAILLYIAYMVVSYVHRAVLHGWAPHLPIAPNNGAFSATNFFYGFIPALIAQIVFLCWLSVDYAFRRLQPYVAMSDLNNRGAPATRSMLSDYSARLPFTVTLAALAHRDFLVAWFSFVTLIAATLPVLAGGCFMSQFYIPDQQTRVSADRPAYYVLNVFLFIVAISLLLAFLRARRRRLPHAVTTLAEQFSWLYASRVLGEREWRHQALSETEMSTRLLAASTERERELDGGRFAFGRFIGRDGRPHLGIERVGRGERGSTRMTERSWRGNSVTPVNGVAYATEYHAEKPIEEEALLNGNRDHTPVTIPAVIQTSALSPRIQPGPSPVALRAPPIAQSRTTVASGGAAFYDPYAQPQTTGPAGFAVSRELAPEPVLIRQVQQVAADPRTGVVAPGEAPRVPGLAQMPRVVGPGEWAGEVRDEREWRGNFNTGSNGMRGGYGNGNSGGRQVSGGRGTGRGATYV